MYCRSIHRQKDPAPFPGCGQGWEVGRFGRLLVAASVGVWRERSWKQPHNVGVT